MERLCWYFKANYMFQTPQWIKSSYATTMTRKHPSCYRFCNQGHLSQVFTSKYVDKDSKKLKQRTHPRKTNKGKTTVMKTLLEKLENLSKPMACATMASEPTYLSLHDCLLACFNKRELNEKGVIEALKQVISPVCRTSRHIHIA